MKGKKLNDKLDRQLLKMVTERRNCMYKNPDSISKKYDEFLAMNGVYYSVNRNIFERQIKNRIDLCNGIIALRNEATLDNERISLINDLIITGYDSNALVEMILDEFFYEPRPSNLWNYADLLYSIKNYRYMSRYIQIISDESYGEDRQMLILLVGKRKNKDTIPILTELLNDCTVYGHALQALSNFQGYEIQNIMKNYVECDKLWIKKIAKRYLSKHK